MIHIIKAFQDSQEKSEKQERERLSLDKRMALFDWEYVAIKGEGYRYELGFNKNPDDTIIELVESHYGSGKALEVAGILNRED